MEFKDSHLVTILLRFRASFCGNFHGTRKCRASFQGREATNRQAYPGMMPIVKRHRGQGTKETFLVCYVREHGDKQAGRVLEKWLRAAF